MEHPAIAEPESPRVAKPRGERRHVWRLHVYLTVETARGHAVVAGYTDDVGGGGVRFVSDASFMPGTAFILRLPEFSKSDVFPCVVLETTCAGPDGRCVIRAAFETDSVHSDSVKKLQEYVSRKSEDYRLVRLPVPA